MNDSYFAGEDNKGVHFSVKARGAGESDERMSETREGLDLSPAGIGLGFGIVAGVYPGWLVSPVLSAWLLNVLGSNIPPLGAWLESRSEAVGILVWLAAHLVTTPLIGAVLGCLGGFMVAVCSYLIRRSSEKSRGGRELRVSRHMDPGKKTNEILRRG